MPEGIVDEWAYPKGVVPGRMPIDPLSIVAYNVIVAANLDEA